ncbi:hypothetical protein GRX03_04210 [Halovenus sp. WSH3]|uniref:DUF7282 domain-containing protein n=1 Tax=Halovenus carboxidivorans TaxID=2692199 RepID=A0A6B0TC78_9EURY|nr:hypothetical protein [Halovenus carboxidivorans]MXR50809.1 hypothetical protein [Halovenus carboxidivorans]
MPDDSLDSPRRRKLLASMGAGVVAYGAAVGGTAAQTQQEVQATLNNISASAWEVTSVEGDDEFAEMGVENPELTLRVGTRYTIQNDGWSSHPLEFRDADGDALLSQSTDGSFEGDSETDWVDDGTSVSFTVTSELADELDSYICTVHGQMNGSIRTVQQSDSDAPADVTMSDQSSDGVTVTVDSARLDDGGFVTIHDSTLLDGDAIGSVRGTSEYIEPGSVENLDVELDDPLVEGDTLIAMPHRDSNDNETYDFVSSGANADPPYTAEGDAVTDDADVQVDTAAATLITDQRSDGESVTVDFTRVDDGGFVTIHDSTLLDGDALGSVRGTSEYLESGTYEDLEVTLDDPLAEGDTLIAMPHRDTNGNETYDFVSSEANADAPYTDDSGAITNAADVQVTAADVRISDQATNGETVTVDFARVDDGGFVTIHDSTLLDGDAVGSVRGTSEYLEPGSVENLEIGLDDPLTENDTLIAMPHRDTNGNQTYDFVSSGANADAPYTDSDGAITDSAAVQVVDASVSFSRQATASPTSTQEGATAPGVFAQVSANTETAVVVTYEDGGDLVIAGLGVFGADALNGEGVTVAVEDAGGFPGQHTVHAIPASELSGDYAPGDTVSAATAGAVVDNSTATVHQAGLTFENQTTQGPVESGDTMATVDASLSGDVTYTVDVHVTNSEGSLVAAEWIGSTNVLTGENEGAEIIAERVPSDGEFNELPFSGTDAFVAMIHLAPDASAGESASPGSGPVVPNVDAEAGPVPGGVTARAEITAEESMDGEDGTDGEDGMDGNDSSNMDGGDSEGGDGGDSSDGSGPGFGPFAGAAGLGSLAAYAYRKLDLDADPATPEDDDLDEDSE